MDIRAILDDRNARKHGTYKADPGRLMEDARIEETVLAGGYGYRQVLELVQNGADAIMEDGIRTGPLDRIHVKLAGQVLYVANTGAPLSEDGLDSLLRSHSSRKRGNQIGRFGLGFKSLLGLKGRVDLMTRNGGVRFDPARCREELRGRYNQDSAPGMRLAWYLGSNERERDPVCQEMSWAETIVRVEIGAVQQIQHVAQEIDDFPAEFLLFFPAPVHLILEQAESRRELKCSRQGVENAIEDGEKITFWRLFHRDVRVTDLAALEDATHLHAREVVPVSWAIPIKGTREEAGRFWAFFPTQTMSNVPGIINAPWKLNSDRNSIIGGAWNAALMGESARLIVESLPELVTPEDPGRILDYFPRKLDHRDHLSAPLLDAVWSAVEISPVIPDAAGSLRLGSQLHSHPVSSSALARIWSDLASEDARNSVVHESCLRGQRGSRLDFLAERLRKNGQLLDKNLRSCWIVDWLAVVASCEPKVAAQVLRLAREAAKDIGSDWQRHRQYLRIIPSQRGALLTSDETVLAPGESEVAGRQPVAGWIRDDSELRKIVVDVLGAQEPDEQFWRDRLAESLRGPWEKIWKIIHQCPPNVSAEFLEKKKGDVKVLRRDGCWVSASEVLLPGRLIDVADADNADLLFDSNFHRSDDQLLRSVGVVDLPAGSVHFDEPRVAFLKVWQDCRARQYKSEISNGADIRYLRPLWLMMPAGYWFLSDLKGEAKSRFSTSLLRELVREQFHGAVYFGHGTRRNVYQDLKVDHPFPMLLASEGVFKIGQASVPLRACLFRRNAWAMSQLSEWREVIELKAFRCPSFELKAVPQQSPYQDDGLHVYVRPSDLQQLWDALIAVLATRVAVERGGLGELWREAALDGIIPKALPGLGGNVMIDRIFVTDDAGMARLARKSSHIVLEMDAATAEKWVLAGAKPLDALCKLVWIDSLGPEIKLQDALPEFFGFLRSEFLQAATSRSVLGLKLQVGDQNQAVHCLVWNHCFYIDQSEFKKLSRSEQYRLMAEALGSAGGLMVPKESVLEELINERVGQRRIEVASGADLAERLLRAVGERRGCLLNGLGEPLSSMEFIRDLDSCRLAELTISQLGSGVLIELQSVLREEGLSPPKRWGTAEAFMFVEAIGFPPEFALSSESRRDSAEFVNGPIELPPLHDFQESVFQSLEELLRGTTGRRRALVMLPTGGGKTRVAVETAVRLVLKPEGDRRSVLWIAQTDELCEQAVQQFRQVWINLGARNTDLTIWRLWGGNNDPSNLDAGAPVVVVASVQTLNARVFKIELDWLRTPELIVVDEAHHAITPSYTNVMRWIGADGKASAGKTEPAIIGLSATPFRTNDDESHRLARRFDDRLFPIEQSELRISLLKRGILARAHYEEFDSEVGLTDHEIAQLSALGNQWEGLESENLIEQINQRLGTDDLRNEKLMEIIKESDETSILFFTNSVLHSKVMAAKLNIAGIPAAAVSGDTRRSVRRWFLNRFQRGELRVICNHSVLTTGFDAPRTDMVLISRQVFSPVRYMQMVGRGLRGPKNGGTESCRIVTVIDNLGRFKSRHAHHYCRPYFEYIK